QNPQYPFPENLLHPAPNHEKSNFFRGEFLSAKHEEFFFGKNKHVLQELQKRGHEICIATGRNYLSALPFYKEIGLNGFLITYNGAYIHHPIKKDRTLSAVIPISKSVVQNILTKDIIQKNLLNIMVDSIDRESISTSDDVYYQEVFFNHCLQLVLEFPNEEKKINKIISTLRKEHKYSITFYYGEKLKAAREGEKILVPDPTKSIIKIRNYNANKGEAAKLVASSCEVPLMHTIAFGNDINDIEMMEKVGIGVAVSNSVNNLKAYVHDITEFDSHSGGVAKYLTDYFGWSVIFPSTQKSPNRWLVPPPLFLIGVLGRVSDRKDNKNSNTSRSAPFLETIFGKIIIVIIAAVVEKDGYEACQLAFGQCRSKILNQPQLGHLNKNNLSSYKYLREIRDMSGFEVGSLIDLSCFQAGEKVKITGDSLGKGTAGVVKRHGFALLGGSHGVGPIRRSGGSLAGGRGTRQKVSKNKKMAGRMGNKK
ncbi:2166_t:CDS:2, partial [Scutellospora calospora]